MPLCLFALLKFSNPQAVDTCIREVVNAPHQSHLLTACKVRFPVIHSTEVDTFVTKKEWDILLVFVSPGKLAPVLPFFINNMIIDKYTIVAGVPSRITNNYKEYNQKLINTPQPALTIPLDDNPKFSQDSQSLSLSSDLLSKGRELVKEWNKPVSQLNLLKFHPGKTESYHRYGKEFVKVAGKRGGDAKIVGVVPKDGTEIWDEVSLVHYPTIMHFCDMSAGDDYKYINDTWRRPALADTLLICTTEIDLEPYRNPKAKY